ncbi:MAG: hypothetical protein P1U91_10090 [Pseudophaeobacter sp. bin_em_oilr2.035]|uniref:Uncharacterized protein n=1 Tax=Phaeobacter gallaeciensis TaxID=60890 RepID=A0ABD4X6E4_9RHOB|nr:hypothetical protein [Phaeobacter gallaeciensis]MDF1772290.1 hypothetical protein [Pseudophaeobacter sp. bin_em_oilr2.035]MDE4059831.1 hypothetical protein [Phaeobacter gallaeciensis]MDE4122532.1 hypothetical protein [Phaeobacter gallaeciensis]MDE4127319.1 hypothetical protein [Phaeobacter gallaeciensis]MDE4144453.1 hypothetical protein [Phaeobacter gallaeciensis]
MAKRFIYVPDLHNPGVKEVALEFQWYPGFAISQKQKSIISLHNAAEEAGYHPILEISSKSEDELGVKASAFNLSFFTKSSNRKVSVESAFQGSKVFAYAGPFPDMYDMTARQAKKEIRVRQNGTLTGFNFFGKDFPIRPRTFFYDWLYINTLHKDEELSTSMCRFAGFSDIEFNPDKSVNCQAFSAALYVSLVRCDALEQALESERSFKELLTPFYERRERSNPLQRSLI